MDDFLLGFVNDGDMFLVNVFLVNNRLDVLVNHGSMMLMDYFLVYLIDYILMMLMDDLSM